MSDRESETERFFRNVNGLIELALGAFMFYVAGALAFGIFVAVCLLFDTDDGFGAGSALALLGLLSWLFYFVAVDLVRAARCRGSGSGAGQHDGAGREEC